MNQALPIYHQDVGLFGLRVNRNMNSLETNIDSKRPIYILSELKNQSSIFLPHIIIMFLSGIDCSKMLFKNKQNRNKKYKEFNHDYKFDKCLTLFESRPVNDNEEEEELVKVLKVYYDKPGNFFLIQVIKPSVYLK